MSETNAESRFLVAVRREWWLPLVTAAAAVAIGLAVSAADPTPLYEGTSVIAVDTAVLSKYPDLPKPDDVVSHATSDEFLSVVASASAVPAQTVRAGLKVFTRGPTQGEIAVTFRSPDASKATSVTVVAARTLCDKAIDMGGPEVLAVQRLVEETERMLDEVRKVDNEAPASERDAAYELELASTQWAMHMRLFEDRLELRKLRASYFYNGNVATADIAPVRRRGATVAGAVVLGLVLGLVLAVLREAVLSRPDASSVDDPADE
ncbi:MAG: hypothetical protein LLG24_04670 [Actinomycetia bacterium]|nr:hypothetical protein [Actinomycetes bacterium]